MNGLFIYLLLMYILFHSLDPVTGRRRVTLRKIRNIPHASGPTGSCSAHFLCFQLSGCDFD